MSYICLLVLKVYLSMKLIVDYLIAINVVTFLVYGIIRPNTRSSSMAFR